MNKILILLWFITFSASLNAQDVEIVANSRQSAAEQLPTPEEQDEIDANNPLRGEVSTSFAGDGTESSPYLISSAADLRLLSDECRSGVSYADEYFKMTQNIVINTNVLNSDGEPNGDSQFEPWIPIGREDYPFCGTFDGNGYTISGIYIHRNNIFSDEIGLFGVLAGSIKNLSIIDSYIYNDHGGYLAGVAGYVDYVKINGEYTNPYISNCHNYATVHCGFSGLSHVGGIAGQICGNTIIDKCSNYGSIKCGYGEAGGISGRLDKSYILNCYNSGTIYSEDQAAGIASWLGGTGKTADMSACMYNCYNKGKVVYGGNKEISGLETSAGICTYLYNGGIIKNNFNIGEIVDGDGNKKYPLIGRVYKSNCTYSYYSEKTGTDTRYTKMTEKAMKEQSFIDELNENIKNISIGTINVSDNITLSTWVKGEDGFPTFDWVKNFVSNIDLPINCVNKNKLQIVNGMVNINGMKPGTYFQLYTISGLQVLVGHVDRCGCANIDMNMFNKGFYLLRTPNENYKIFNK